MHSCALAVHYLSMIMVLRLVVVSLVVLEARAAETLDLEETLVLTAMKPRELASVSPRYGTALGGTRLSILGEGFAVDLVHARARASISDSFS